MEPVTLSDIANPEAVAWPHLCTCTKYNGVCMVTQVPPFKVGASYFSAEEELDKTDGGLSRKEAALGTHGTKNRWGMNVRHPSYPSPLRTVVYVYLN